MAVRELIATGDTVEMAINNACIELGISTDNKDYDYEVIEHPTKKTFGLFGGNPAKIKVVLSEKDSKSATQDAANYLKLVLSKMGIDKIDIEIEENEDNSEIKLSGEDIGFIIGHRGETLDALQYLASLVANQKTENYYRVTLDVGDFRQKRKETLESLAKRIAEKSVKIGRNNSLEPMNPYERRIIHTAVQEIEGAKSWSEGLDMNRHVVIGPVDGEKPRRSRYNNNYNKSDKRGKSGHGGGHGQRNNYSKNNYAQRNAPNPKISETAELPFSPAPLDSDVQKRPKAEDAPLYGRIK